MSRLPDETAKAFAAYCLYRDMPPRDRSAVGAYRIYSGRDQVKMIPGWFNSWTSRFTWTARVLAFDEAEDSRRLEDTKAVSRRVRIKAWDFLEALVDKQIERLKSAAILDVMDADQSTRAINSMRELIKTLDERDPASVMPTAVTAGPTYSDPYLETDDE